jgi:hypothetical protein
MCCVLENSTKRDLALFVLAFGIAGCLMIWTINLSISRLLWADEDQKASEPKQHVQSVQQDRPSL